MADTKLEASLELDIEQAIRALRQFRQTLGNEVPKAAKQGADGLKKFQSAAANATPTLTNFGRVVQDAPFGLIGIANNIDPLINSFQQLKQQTGTTGGALKALFSSLAGPAGIAIAISTVTSALIAFGPEIKAFFNGVSASEKAARELNEALGEEFAKLGSLEKAFTNVNATREQKLAIIKKLRQDYGPYLKDLTDEQILQNGITEAINRSTKAIEDRLRAQAFEANAAKKITEQLNTRLEIERISRQIEAEKAQQASNYAKQQQAAGKAQELAASTTLASGLRIASLQNERNKLLQQDLELQAQINNDLDAAGQFKLPTFITATKEAQKETKKLAQSVKEVNTNFNPALVTPDPVKQQPVLQDFPQTLEELEKINNIVTDIGQTAFGQFLNPKINEAADSAANILNGFNLLSPSIDQAFNALANGQNAFDAIGQSVKRLIVDLAKAAAFAAVLSLVSGGAGAAASGGVSFLTAFKKILGFRAAGGPVSGGNPYIVGEKGPELFVPENGGRIIPNSSLMNGGGAMGGVLTARVEGSDLLFVLERAQRSAGRRR